MEVRHRVDRGALMWPAHEELLRFSCPDRPNSSERARLSC